MSDPLAAKSICARAAAAGIDLDVEVGEKLREHALRVLAANELLHLTTVVDRAAFLERHIGESFEGVALLRQHDSALPIAMMERPDAHAALLDLGSGNGYPGIPVALTIGASVLLTEANRRKAVFLDECLAGVEGSQVIDRQVQRPADLPADVALDHVAWITTRAMGSWEKVLPRFAGSMTEGAVALVWAGPEAEEISRRSAWKRLSLVSRRSLPGRDRSWVWLFRVAV